jgi:hypothetical protein
MGNDNRAAPTPATAKSYKVLYTEGDKSASIAEYNGQPKLNVIGKIYFPFLDESSKESADPLQTAAMMSLLSDEQKQAVRAAQAAQKEKEEAAQYLRVQAVSFADNIAIFLNNPSKPSKPVQSDTWTYAEGKYYDFDVSRDTDNGRSILFATVGSGSCKDDVKKSNLQLIETILPKVLREMSASESIENIPPTPSEEALRTKYSGIAPSAVPK